jgi:hypothetical protein
MIISRRGVVFVFFLLIVLLVGMLFWPFILNEIIKPISLVVWLFLRIFVLSIDQKYYWTAIIFVVVIFLYRLFLPVQSTVSSEEFTDSNKTISTIGYWRRLFIPTDRNTHDDIILKRELARLLVSLYGTKQHTSADFRLYDALHRGEIPLPETIHTFLFSEEPQKSGRTIKKFLQSIRKTPRKWIRHWTGQETAEHYQMIDEVLSFMEISLEMKNDDGKFNPNKH